MNSFMLLKIYGKLKKKFILKYPYISNYVWDVKLINGSGVRYKYWRITQEKLKFIFIDQS